MTVLLYQPDSSPAPDLVIEKWTSCQHIWTGWDGSSWDLSFGASGLKLRAGTRGLEMPPYQRFSTKAAAVPGSLHRGSIADEREVFWPISMFSDDGTEAWIEHNRRFWDTMDPERPGTWTVVQPSGEWRSLDIRYVGLADDGTDDDHGLRGWAQHGINFVAEQPFWRGAPIVRQFLPSNSGVDYYGGGAANGYGPPYVTQPGSTADTAVMENPGQEPASPTWKVIGPTTSVSVGLDGHHITVPFSQGAGQWVTIDTKATAQTAIDQDGNDRTLELGLVDWAEIPRGASVPLELVINGTGSVEVSIEPLYRRATG